MGAFESFLSTVQAGVAGKIPYGGVLVPTAAENAIILAMQVKGGGFVVPDQDTLADIPFNLLSLDMTVTVSEFTGGGGKINPRTKYYLYNMPPDGVRVSEVSSYLISNYWRIDGPDQSFQAEIEVQYAPNYLGQRPLFLPTQISYDAYQAGYPTTALFIGGNPADIIWTSVYDPTKNHLWMRQRLTSQPWGIPISIAAGNYESGQYIDVIFLWQNKGDAYPGRPVQPNDSSLLPAGWDPDPGPDYATKILTQDLYRSQAVRNAYGVLKSDWDLPILVSTDPQLTRYGNAPGNTDFLNDTFWRGYYTPGLDTFQATRPNGTSTNWTVSKIDQESGEFPDFVFKAFPIGTDPSDLIAATPTAPVPLNGTFPNDWNDAPVQPADTEIVYMSTATKFNDGSLKTPWSTPKRFDGLDTIQAVIEESPGDTFFQTRNDAGSLVYAFSSIDMVAKLFKAQNELSGIVSYNWYRDGTLIVFSGITHLATNLGSSLNPYHTISPDGSTLTINPQGVDVSTTYKVGIVHPSRDTEYPATIQIRDSTDDGNAFVADIISISGTTFKNKVGLFEFDASFYKGGVVDLSGVVFTWSIKNPAGAALTGALRNAGGSSIGDTNVAAASVYVSGVDVDQYAVLVLTAVFGGVVRTHRITLTDIVDGAAIEALYWGTGSTDPGTPTTFSPRTITSAEVLALAIGYSSDATARWYMIQRISGTWGGPIKLRSESARPNGGIALTVYKNVQLSLGVPAVPAVPATGSIVPVGWTSIPSAFAGLEDATFITSCFFLLRTDVAADPTVLTRDNYNPSGAFGAVVRITGIDGTNSDPGINGDDGWSPVLAIASDGERRVLQLVDWVGGTGTKPAAGGTSSYIGTSGLTAIGAAVDVRGAAGADALVRPQYGVQSNSGDVSGPELTIGVSDLEISVDHLNIINTMDSARLFLVEAQIGFRQNVSPGSGIYVVTLRSKSGAWAGESDATVRTYHIEDRNKDRADIDYTAPLTGQQISVKTIIAVPAASTVCVIVTAQLTNSSSSSQGRRNNGRVIAIGL